LSEDIGFQTIFHRWAENIHNTFFSANHLNYLHVADNAHCFEDNDNRYVLKEIGLLKTEFQVSQRIMATYILEAIVFQKVFSVLANNVGS